MKIGPYRLEKDEPDLWKGLFAGLVAGLVATYVKDRFQRNWSEISKAASPQPEESTADEAATVKMAVAISRKVTGKELSKEQKQVAGPIVDYAVGTLAGGLYGATAEFAPGVSIAGGLPFAAALWLAGDELAVPAAGLAKWPQKYPASTHAYSLGGHLVYGGVLELVRRIVRYA